MSDRELLEAAAKAAWIEYDAEASKPHPKSGAFWGLWLVYHDEPSEYARRYWNPRADDGDALRLAVRLGMDIQRGYHGGGPVVIVTHGGIQIIELLEPDYCAATRRAIVICAAAVERGRAAAALGSGHEGAG